MWYNCASSPDSLSESRSHQSVSPLLASQLSGIDPSSTHATKNHSLIRTKIQIPERHRSQNLCNIIIINAKSQNKCNRNDYSTKTRAMERRKNQDLIREFSYLVRKKMKFLCSTKDGKPLFCVRLRIFDNAPTASLCTVRRIYSSGFRNCPKLSYPVWGGYLIVGPHVGKNWMGRM